MDIRLEDLPVEIQELLARSKSEGTRSPVPRPLTDLREPSDPKKRLHRPSFFFETGPDLPPYKHQEYPKVKWHQNGTDTLVLSEAAEKALGPEWGDIPQGTPLDMVDVVKAELADLTPEEQAMVFEAHREARVKSLLAKFDTLSDAELAALETSVARKAKKG